MSWNGLNAFKGLGVEAILCPNSPSHPALPEGTALLFSFPNIGRKKLTVAVMSPFGMKTPTEFVEGIGTLISQRRSNRVEAAMKPISIAEFAVRPTLGGQESTDFVVVGIEASPKRATS